jgi:CrcB protein
MPSYVLVAIGGALGSVARFWCSGLVARLAGETFPWGTMAVNVVGSLIIGFAAALSAPEGRFLVPPEARTFVMVGFCGGYTTFSSFSLQTFALMQEGEFLWAAGNIVLSVLLCLVGVWLGYLAGASLNA